jgi:hypothetical protein
MGNERPRPGTGYRVRRKSPPPIENGADMQYTWFASILGGLCLFAILGAFATVSLLGISGIELMGSTNVSLLDRWSLLSALQNCTCICTIALPCLSVLRAPCLYLYRDDIHA